MNNLTGIEQARFATKWTKVGDCHVWTSPLDSDGYGVFYLRRKTRKAHRVAWFAQHGPIPEGMVINHACRNRACVNVQHLGLVTVSANATRDSTSVGYINSQKTHCPRGHAYDGVTAYGPKKKRQRICKTCERDKARRLRAKWTAEDTLQV